MPTSSTCLRKRDPSDDLHSATIGLRTLPSGERPALIFDRFEALQPGRALHAADDHGRVPLCLHFEG